MMKIEYLEAGNRLACATPIHPHAASIMVMRCHNLFGGSLGIAEGIAESIFYHAVRHDAPPEGVFFRLAGSEAVETGGSLKNIDDLEARAASVFDELEAEAHRKYDGYRAVADAIRVGLLKSIFKGNEPLN